MYHRAFFTDSTLRVRPDLRELALRDWDGLPVERGFVWRSAGPAGVLLDGAPPIAGLVSSIAVGANPDHVVVGTRSGGVWRTRDAGGTWTALGDRLPSLQTIAAAVAERGGGLEPVLMAGCGELHEERLRYSGLPGIYRSVDGGLTWAVADGGMGATHFRSHDVNQVVLLDADRVIVATRVGLYFSQDGGRNFGADAAHRDGRPLLRGPVTEVVVDGSDVGAVIGGEPPAARDPRPPDLATQLVAPSQEPGLWMGQLTGSSLAFAAAAPARRSRALNPGVVPGNTALAHRGPFWLMSVARAEIPGDTWPQVMAAIFTNPHQSIHVTRRPPAASGWGSLGREPVSPDLTHYCHAVAIEPSAAADAFHAWFGSVDLYRARPHLTPGDGGDLTWVWFDTAVKLGGRDTPVHADQHALQVVEPAPGSVRLYVGNDGGFYVRDGAAAFVARNSHATLLLWTIAIAATATGTVRLIAGAQDNGTLVGEGPADPPSAAAWAWREFGAGDGGALAFVPRSRAQGPTEDPNEALTTANGWLLTASGTAVANWQQDRVHRFPADSTADSNVFIYTETLVVGRSLTGEWNRIYFGNAGERNGPGLLHVLEGPLRTPFTVSPPAPHPVGPRGEFAATITALAAAPADPATETLIAPAPWDHLWIGLANGEVWLSHDGGATLARVNVGGGPFPVTGIAVDPQNSRRVAVVYGGYRDSAGAPRSGHVFLTTDGATFTDISGRRDSPDGFFPDMPALGVKFTRTDPPALVVATDLGVLLTSGPDLGRRWTRLGVGLPKTPCSAIDVLNPGPAVAPPPLAGGLPLVAAATFGRGAWLLARPAAAEAFVELDGGFGALRLGAERRRRLTLHNVGNAPLTIAAPAAPPPFSFDGLAPGPLTVPARDARSWTVVCRPVATGIVTGSLTVGGAVPVSCEAFDTGPPRLAIIPRDVSFGAVPDGQVVARQVVLVNQGLGDLHVNTITPAAANSAQILRDSVVVPPVVLAPGDERVVTLRFSAAGVGSTHQAEWQLSTDDPVQDPGHFTIRARGEVVAVGAPPPLPGPGPGPGSGGGSGGTPPWVPIALGGGLETLGALLGHG